MLNPIMSEKLGGSYHVTRTSALDRRGTVPGGTETPHPLWDLENVSTKTACLMSRRGRPARDLRADGPSGGAVVAFEVIPFSKIRGVCTSTKRGPVKNVRRIYSGTPVDFLGNLSEHLKDDGPDDSDIVRGRLVTTFTCRMSSTTHWSTSGTSSA